MRRRVTAPGLPNDVGAVERGICADSLPSMDRPAPDPAKLLADWMEWEKGETPPGKVIANLKTHGMRDLLDSLVAALSADAPA